MRRSYGLHHALWPVGGAQSICRQGPDWSSLEFFRGLKPFVNQELRSFRRVAKQEHRSSGNYRCSNGNSRLGRDFRRRTKMHRETTPDERRQQIDWQSELALHERWLRTIVRARVRESDAVDDVMQEVALAAIEQKSPVNDPTKVAPWLYRVAVMQSLLYRRSRGRR